MTDRIDHLRDIFSALGDETSFTERQEQPRGTIRSRAAVDADIRAVVRDLRESTGFRTTLSDDDLVHVVRGFFDGKSDTTLASALGVATATVFRARMNLHLFRPEDAPSELTPAVVRLRAGDAPADIAATLGVSTSTIERVKRLLSAREAARRVNYRYTTEFADLLDADSVDVALDRQVWNDRRALVDATD